jgi:hypothetical protein
MTDREQLTWPPREALRWYPERPVSWAWIVAPLILVLTSIVLTGLVLSLPWLAGGL